jgi:single-strand DNA-binding protein
MIEAAFMGTLGRDAEAKTSKAGKPYLRLAVRAGEGDKAAWVSVTCFDPDAIAVAGKLVKGAKVYVEGTGLKIDEWTGQDGKQRHGLSCMSFHTRLCAIGRNKPPKSGREPAAQPAALGGSRFHDDTIPFSPEWR